MLYLCPEISEYVHIEILSAKDWDSAWYLQEYMTSVVSYHVGIEFTKPYFCHFRYPFECMNIKKIVG